MNRKIRTVLSVLAIGILLTLLSPYPSHAGPRGKQQKINNLLKKQGRIEAQLSRLLKSITPTSLKAIVSKHSSNDLLNDSDGDGVPDEIENPSGSDACDRDSDHDGEDDGDEIDDGTDPSSVEARGTVTEITPTSITIDKGNGTPVTYLIDVNTEFEDALEFFVVGAQVKVEGEFREENGSMVLYAREIEVNKNEDDDDNSDGDHDDDHDHSHDGSDD